MKLNKTNHTKNGYERKNLRSQSVTIVRAQLTFGLWRHCSFASSGWLVLHSISEWVLFSLLANKLTGWQTKCDKCFVLQSQSWAELDDVKRHVCERWSPGDDTSCCCARSPASDWQIRWSPSVLALRLAWLLPSPGFWRAIRTSSSFSTRAAEPSGSLLIRRVSLREWGKTLSHCLKDFLLKSVF